MAESRHLNIANKLAPEFSGYLQRYRDYIAVTEQSDAEVEAAWKKRIMQRLRAPHDDDAIAEAVQEENEVLKLLGEKPHQHDEKQKISGSERFFKKALKIASDNDTSGYAARKAPSEHTTQEVGTIAPIENALDHVATDYAAVGLQGFNLLTVPLLYLYYYAKGEPIPFSLKNNLKMGMAGIGLSLAIVSVAVPPVGMFVALAVSGIGMIISLYALGKNISERINLNKHMQAVEGSIEHLSEGIKSENDQAKQQKENIIAELKSQNPSVPNLKLYEDKLRASTSILRTKHTALRSAVKDRSALRVDKTAGKTFFSTLSSSMKVFLTASVIAGTALAAIPFTAPIGGALLTTALAIGVGLFIANKIVNAKAKKLEKEYANKDLLAINESLENSETVSKKSGLEIENSPSTTRTTASALNDDPKTALKDKPETESKSIILANIKPPEKSKPIDIPIKKSTLSDGNNNNPRRK